jgi:integrase
MMSSLWLGALCREVDIIGRWGLFGAYVAHCLRAIASTALHEEGFDTLLIEACLSHSDQNETRASYNRSDFFEQRKEIMRWWSGFVSENSDT